MVCDSLRNIFINRLVAFLLTFGAKTCILAEFKKLKVKRTCMQILGFTCICQALAVISRQKMFAKIWKLKLTNNSVKLLRLAQDHLCCFRY